MICPVISRIFNHEDIVGTDTPSGAARSVLFRILPWREASNAMKRLNVLRSLIVVMARTSRSR